MDKNYVVYDTITRQIEKEFKSVNLCRNYLNKSNNKDLCWADRRALDYEDLCLIDPFKTEPELSKEMETVDLIPSGYEWTCPKCDTLNEEIEEVKEVKCNECGKEFLTYLN